MKLIKKFILVFVLMVGFVALTGCAKDEDTKTGDPVVVPTPEETPQETPEEVKYVVTFDVDGEKTTFEVKEGEKAVKPSNPVKDGFKFLGWYAGDEEYDFETIVTANITLVAKFEEVKYVVTFDVDGAKTTAEVKYNEKVSKPVDPVKEGYTFLGWYVGGEEFDFEQIVNSEITLTAKFEKLPEINITQEVIYMKQGEELDLEYEVSEPVEIIWSSSSNSIVTVKDGKLYAKGVGKATITAKISGTKIKDKVEVEVSENTGIFTISIPTELRLYDISYIEVLNTETDELYEDYEIKLSEEDVVLLQDKKLYGYKEGVVDITVTVRSGENVYEKTVTLYVAEGVAKTEKIEISGNKGIVIGKTIKLEVNTEEEVEYISMNEEVAIVNELGIVTGMKEGTAIVKAVLKSNEDVCDSFEIIVFMSKESTKVAGGEYYYDEVLDYNELPFGVVQYTHWGYTKTDNAGIDIDGIGSSKEIIDINKFYSQQVNVLELPSQLETKVVVWANTNNSTWTLNSVRAMILDYEGKNPGYKVIAAVNGDFFDINGNFNFKNSTSGATVGDGNYFKSNTGNTIAFKNDGTAEWFIGGVPQRTEYLVLNIYDENNNIIGEYQIETVNKEPEAGQSSVYFGVYNKNHDYIPQSFNTAKKSFVIEKAETTLPHSESDFYGIGKISSSISEGTLNKGQFAIVSDNEALCNALNIGTRVRVQYEYIGDFADIESATGVGDRVLIDGEIASDALASANLATRAPRTCIGVREDGTVVMCVIDGRQVKKEMYGLDRNELSSIMKAYGCVDAYNLDGGGSSTMVIRTAEGLKVLNSPSDGNERSDANCVLIVAKDIGYETAIEDVKSNSAVVSVSNTNEEYKDYPVYIKINGEFKEVVDGKVELTGLYHNTKYLYNVYYKNENGEMIQTLTMNSFTTGKKGFELLSVVVKETSDGKYYEVSVNYIDPDNASKIKNAEINVDGIKTYLMNGSKKLRKSLFEGDIKNISIRFSYEENGEELEYYEESVDFVVLPK